MKRNTDLTVTVLGTTRSGKAIFRKPSLNRDFDRKDHFDAYLAHTKFITFHELSADELDFHKQAMNAHYLAGVSNSR
jgi:hypothetical protein